MPKRSGGNPSPSLKPKSLVFDVGILKEVFGSIRAGVAQLVERPICNRMVVSSTLIAGSIFSDFGP